MKAQYIPGAQGATRGLPGQAASRKALPLNQATACSSPQPRERPRAAGHHRCLMEAPGHRGSLRAGKAAGSQSETSLLGRAAGAPLGSPKYPTVEREEPQPPRGLARPSTYALRGVLTPLALHGQDRRSPWALWPTPRPGCPGPALPGPLLSAGHSTAAQTATLSAWRGAQDP